MTQVDCVAGRNVHIGDCIAVFCSKNVEDKGVYDISSDEEDNLIFYVDESNIIKFISERKFGILSPKNFRYRKIVENGSIQLEWNYWKCKITNLKLLSRNSKYDYLIAVPDGNIYLSKRALAKLIMAVEEEHKSNINQRKEQYFLETSKILSFLQTPWIDFVDTYQKIKMFAKTQALPVFVDPNKLSAFESDFNEKWILKSVDQYGSSLIFQTSLKQTDANSIFGIVIHPLQKFDTLVRLVSMSCGWEESHAAVRTYGALLAAIKNEAKEQCNITYNFEIKDNWKYKDCLKNYISCVKENYKDLLCFGCFVYYLMLENQIPIPEKYERIPDHLGFEYAYNVVKQDISPIAKEFFDNIEILQLEKELSIDIPCSMTTIEDYDLMNGQEFEQAISEIFKTMGYQVTMTPHTGDQGIDIIAIRNGIRIGIQAKCYTGKVGNSAVQEVVAGKKYYNLNRCMVVTNSTFTSAAIKLAQVNNVTLWDRSILEEKLFSLNHQVE